MRYEGYVNVCTEPGTKKMKCPYLPELPFSSLLPVLQGQTDGTGMQAAVLLGGL